MYETTRREFIKTVGKSALALSGGLTLDSLLKGCATVPILAEEPTVVYPPLEGDKVQPPEEGCLIGFYKHYRHTNPRFPSGVTQDSGRPIDYYLENIGHRPAIFVLLGNISLFGAFPMQDSVEAATRGVIPFIFAETSPRLAKSGHKRLDDIAQGMYDKGANDFAEGAVEFGEKYGGFLLTTMWEMNITNDVSPYVWTEQPKSFIKTWQHLWELFEAKGANRYATWVQEYHVDFPIRGYHPGNQFVDWIGLSAHNRAEFRWHYGYRYIDNLIGQKYGQIRRNHKDKPLMLSEMSTSIGKEQPKWIKKSYECLKKFPGLKAANFFDNTYQDPRGWIDHHYLTREGLAALKDVLEDPYFIKARSQK